MIVVVEGASVFNIDFAAGIFSGILFPENDITLLLNDKPIISDIKEHRKFISRLSFPILKWTYATDNDKKSNDNVWHLEYLPIDDFSAENTHEKFHSIEKALLSLVESGNCIEHSQAMIDRLKQLALLSKKIPNSRKSKWQILFYSEVIKAIFNDTLKRDFKVELVGGFKKLNTTNYNKIGILTSQIFQELKSIPKLEYKFTKGGYIEITKDKAKPVKLDTVAMQDNQRIILKNSESGKKFIFRINYLNASSSNARLKNLVFSCRGPIQMLMLRRFAVLAHLPWYGRAVLDTSKENHCHEYISPISVSDLTRVSKRFGGDGNRLFPSGYSLLDYETDEVLCLVRGICQDQRVTFASLYDWKDLSDNYPKTNEKLAEHQREVIPYLTQKSDFAHKDFRKGRLQNSKLLFKDLSELTFAEYGVYVIELTAFLEHIRNIIAHNNDIHLTHEEIVLLQSKGWLDNKRMFNAVPILKNIELAFQTTLQKLENLGFNHHKAELLMKSMKHQADKIKATQFFPTTKKDLQQFLEYKHICHLAPSTEKLLEYYYSFVSFTVSTLLKANIFTCYILFGAEKYKKLIQEILDKRGNKKYLKFKPIYFQPVNQKKSNE